MTTGPPSACFLGLACFLVICWLVFSSPGVSAPPTVSAGTPVASSLLSAHLRSGEVPLLSRPLEASRTSLHAVFPASATVVLYSNPVTWASTGLTALIPVFRLVLLPRMTLLISTSPSLPSRLPLSAHVQTGASKCPPQKPPPQPSKRKRPPGLPSVLCRGVRRPPARVFSTAGLQSPPLCLSKGELGAGLTEGKRGRDIQPPT